MKRPKSIQHSRRILEYTLDQNRKNRYAEKGKDFCHHNLCGQELHVGDRIVRKFASGAYRTYTMLYHKGCAERLNII